MFRARLIVVALWLVGCRSVGATTDAAPIDPNVTVQLGDLDDGGGFEVFSDGREVELVEGAQGGFHVWMRYRAGAEVGLNVQLERTARRVGDGALVLRSSSVTTLEAESERMPMFMCPSPVGIRVVDEPIRFELRFLGDDEQTLCVGSVTLVPRCPEANRDFCLRICAG